ncbi:hypothetical protein BVG16_16260 [Paenibacillus selenitireducens]|uniref:Lipoprotein n=1 Tax=Paenibacillus selenitireducens TaxID=1324314 RepID=A0A1T2XAV1_9BACL|nr:hypothetical protein BVG16_16260 [Paenibacillus selenitireducens]
MKSLLILFLVVINVLILSGCGDPEEKIRESSRYNIVKSVEMYLEYIDSNIINDSLRDNLLTVIKRKINELNSNNINDSNMENYQKLVEYIEGGRETDEVRRIYSALGGE